VEAIRAKTTVPATSLVVHNQPGLTYLFCKQWQAKDLDGKPYEGPIGILVERNKKGEVRLNEATERCRRLFPSACYEFTAPGDAYKGLPTELGSVMRRLYGILARAEERNENEQNPGQSETATV
jgi:hypothetical protein